MASISISLRRGAIDLDVRPRIGLDAEVLTGPDD